MGASCAIRLLGGFGVTVGDEPVSVDAWRSRRAADLVKLLALEPTHELHREQVMDALWPDLPPDAASANLRKAIHFARRALGSPDAVTAEGNMLRLWPEPMLEVDVADFEILSAEALERGDAAVYARAVEAYTGDLLPSDRFEPWTAEARTRLRARYIAVLKGAGAWERVLELDPTDEAAHRALMQQHLDAGDRREAIRQFERLRDALREHIGVAPDPATVALYETVLAMEGDEAPTVSERAAALLANGLVAWGRRDLAEAERLARDARTLALTAGLGHEAGEASTLLALIAYARGTWHDLFREEFADSVRQDRDVEDAVYDAHLCFQEFYLYGSEGHDGADRFARELLAMAERAGSAAGRALALLLLGEFALLSGDLDGARETLEAADGWADKSGCVSARSIALERLAETLATAGDRATARRFLSDARPYADGSAIPSHLVVRLYGVQLLAAEHIVDAVHAVNEAERWIADAPRVCEPCSMTFRIEAARASARAGDLVRARRYVNEAERITGLWQGGPWIASVWEARAEVRRAEGNDTQARALFLEAADRFAEFRRPLDEARCRTAATAV